MKQDKINEVKLLLESSIKNLNKEITFKQTNGDQNGTESLTYGGYKSLSTDVDYLNGLVSAFKCELENIESKSEEEIEQMIIDCRKHNELLTDEVQKIDNYLSRIRAQYNLPLRYRVMKFAIPASSVEYDRKVAYTVSRSDIEELNASIEPKIKQNRLERIRSWQSAKDIWVG